MPDCHWVRDAIGWLTSLGHDDWLVIFTFVLAGFTAALWLSTRELWRAGEKQFRLARESFERLERPYLFISDFLWVALDTKKRIGLEPTLSYVVSNGGKLPVVSQFEILRS